MSKNNQTSSVVGGERREEKGGRERDWDWLDSFVLPRMDYYFLK